MESKYYNRLDEYLIEEKLYQINEGIFKNIAKFLYSSFSLSKIKQSFENIIDEIEYNIINYIDNAITLINSKFPNGNEPPDPEYMLAINNLKKQIEKNIESSIQLYSKKIDYILNNNFFNKKGLRENTKLKLKIYWDELVIKLRDNINNYLVSKDIFSEYNVNSIIKNNSKKYKQKENWIEKQSRKKEKDEIKDIIKKNLTEIYDTTLNEYKRGASYVKHSTKLFDDIVGTNSDFVTFRNYYKTKFPTLNNDDLSYLIIDEFSEFVANLLTDKTIYYTNKVLENFREKILDEVLTHSQYEKKIYEAYIRKFKKYILK